MKIRDFIVAHGLFIEKSGNEDIKLTGVLVSDINHDDQISESTWEKQCEWRAYDSSTKIYECSEKPSKVTWSAIAALEGDAKKVADYSN